MVNIACVLRWRVASVGITLLGVAHPIWENISGAGMRWCRLVAFTFYFVKFLEQTSSGMYL